MNPCIPIVIYVFGYIMMFGAWFLIVWMNIPNSESLVSYIHDALLAFSGHVLTMVYPKSFLQNTTNGSPPQ